MQKSIWHSRRSSPLPAGDLAQWFPGRRSCPNVAPIAACTALATVLPLLVIAASLVTGSHALLVAELFIETVLLVNAVGHSLTALLLGSYVPGLISAVVINLPVGIYVLQRASREQWIRPNAAWQLIGPGDCAAFDLAQQRVLASALTSSRLSHSSSCSRHWM